MFTVNLIGVGYQKAFGILYVEFRRTLGNTASFTSLIEGLRAGVFSLMSLVTLNVLLEYVTVRKLTLLGSALMSTGILLSGMVGRVELLLVSHGLVFGVGVALVDGPMMVLLSRYFHKRRPLAIAVAMSGISVGSIAIPPLMRHLLDTYELRGALLLYSGVALHMVVCSCLFRGTEEYGKKEETLLSEETTISETCTKVDVQLENKTTLLTNVSIVISADCSNGFADNNGLPVSETEGKSTTSLEYEGVESTSASSIGKCDLPDAERHCLRSRTVSSPSMQSTHGHDGIMGRASASENGDCAVRTREIGTLDQCTNRQALWSRAPSSSREEISDRGDCDCLHSSASAASSVGNSSSLSISDAHTGSGVLRPYEPSQSLARLDSERNRDHSSAQMNKFTPSAPKQAVEHDSTDSSLYPGEDGTSFEHSRVTATRTSHPSARESRSRKKRSSAGACVACGRLAALLDVYMFQDPLFVVLAVVCGLSYLTIAAAAAFLPALAGEMGLSDVQAALMLTVNGCLDVGGRLVAGVLVDRGWVSPGRLLAVYFALLGVAMQLTRLCRGLTKFLAFVAVYGLLGGSYFALVASLVHHVMGSERFPKAYGFVQLFHGASAAAAYPTLGALYDMTGTYTTVYNAIGGCLLLASLLLLLEPLCRRRFGNSRRDVELEKDYTDDNGEDPDTHGRETL